MSAATILRPAPSIVPVGRRPDLARKMLAVLTMLIGMVFLAMTLIVNLFSVGPAFERMTDGFRPVMTQQSIATTRADVAQLAATGNEFQARVVPGLAAQLKMTPAQLNGMMASQFPHVAAGLQAMPTVVPEFQPPPHDARPAGAVLIAAPLVVSLPEKASDADQLNSNLEPAYTQALIRNPARR